MKFFETTKIAASWESADFIEEPCQMAWEAYGRALRSVYSPSAKLATVTGRAIAPLEVAELFTSENWRYSGIARAIWKKAPFRAALAGADADPADDAFFPVNRFELVSLLAGRYHSGGPYNRPRERDLKSAFDLAVPAVECVADEAALILVSVIAWCRYFDDIAWDLTVLVADARRQSITVLLATDQD